METMSFSLGQVLKVGGVIATTIIVVANGITMTLRDRVC